MELPSTWIESEKLIVAFPEFEAKGKKQLDWGQEPKDVSSESATAPVIATYQGKAIIEDQHGEKHTIDVDRQIVSHWVKLETKDEPDGQMIRLSSGSAGDDHHIMEAKSLRVYDTSDWTSGLIRRSSRYFDLPQLLVDFSLTKFADEKPERDAAKTSPIPPRNR